MKDHHTTDEKQTDLTVWYCRGCQVVHLAVDRFRLSFNKTEFAALTQMVLETHYTGWPGDSVRSFAANHVDIEARETTASIEYVH